MKLFVAAIIKNEMDALLEWIAYHRVVGVSGFIIADNGSNDGSRAFLDGLEKLGIVTVLDFPDVVGQKPQLPAYERILRTCSTDIDLLAFIDADEFLVPLDPEQSIAASLDKWFSDPSVSAVALNWSNFGSNGELFAEEGLVTERFTQRASQQFNANKNFKSIVRPNSAIHFNNPHHAELRYGRYIDTLGNELVLHPKHGSGVSEEVVWGEMRVNHYVVKSLEEFLLGKHLRGSAATAKRVKHKAYFKAHDRNDETCLLAAALAPKVKAEMAALQAQLDALPEEESPQKSDSWLASRVKKLIG
ncbi:TPA: glycosyltransferase family 2 protein [Enterobacter roggenkampii]